jgi:serine protease inhibitor
LRGSNENLFFSPYSIAQVLTMISAGARNQTAQKMAQTLHSAFPQQRLHPVANALDLALTSRGTGQEGFHLEIANTVWGPRDLKLQPEFLDLLATNYGAGLRLLDFVANPEPARAAINATIAQQTHDKIQDLLPQGSINSNTRLVLANAIYFNAKWVQPFFQPDTSQGLFNLDKGGQVSVPMMARELMIPYAAGQGYQAITLQYQGGVSMVVLLPDAGRLTAFESELNAAKLQTILDGLSLSDVVLRMPKFEYRSSSISLNQSLNKLGMVDAFDERADFSGINGTGGLYISDCLEKAMVRVDEDGTEAAAASAVMVATASPAPPTQVTLTIDRPFIFLIRDDQTGTLLFMGRILNPTAGSTG